MSQNNYHHYFLLSIDIVLVSLTDTQINKHDKNKKITTFNFYFTCSSESAFQRCSASSSLFHRIKKPRCAQEEFLAQGQKAKQENCFPCQAQTSTKAENKVLCCSFLLFVLCISVPLKVFYVLSPM